MDMMKRILSRPILVCGLLLSGLLAPVHAQAPADAPGVKLEAGSEVTTEVFGKLDWIQGEAPSAWEPGKVYILECWATWCGPCIAVIPHVNGLYQKYQDKGLRVIGVNVWEDGRDKVAAFVEKKGDGMSYPVAYTGRGGAFETDWLKPAGVTGIPHAFVVRDGKVLFKTHPSRLTEEVVEALLEGGEAADKVVEDIARQGRMQAGLAAASRAFQEAAREGKVEEMEAKLEELRKLTGGGANLAGPELQLDFARKDWVAAGKRIAGRPEGTAGVMLLRTAAGLAEKAAEVPMDLLKEIAGAYEGLGDQLTSPMDFRTIAVLHWKAGDKEAAVVAARKALELVKSPDLAKRGAPVVPFEKFLAALEAGQLPAADEFMGWLREAAEARRRGAAGE